MSARALRLSRSWHILPSITKRPLATGAPYNQQDSSGREPRAPSEENSIPIKRYKSRSEVYQGLAQDHARYVYNNKIKHEASKATKGTLSPPTFVGLPSTIHGSLADCYECDIPLPQASQDQRFTKYGAPLWDSRGVPVKFRSVKGPTISTLPNFWLRDNCRCKGCVNQDTMQRSFDTFSIPPDISPTQVVPRVEGLEVTWNEPSAHISLYSWDWIMKHRRLTDRLVDQNGYSVPRELPTYKYWGSKIMKGPPSVHYDEIMADDKGVGKWLRRIREFGFCYVDGCPVSPEKTQELLERISFIRLTHYGGFYDFTADLTMKDTAYTNLALPAHTDTTYFTDPAGLQMFHLLSHESGSGGASLLIDGFNAARTLFSEDPQAHDILEQMPIPWHASGNAGITIVPTKEFPVLSVRRPKPSPRRGTDTSHQEVFQVRWNNDDRGPVGLNGPYTWAAQKWYEAARKWDEILKRDKMQYWAQMEPGRPLIFDNWRVLHGRSAFTGKRRICGGYINHDDYVSRWRNANFSRKEVLKQIL